VSAPAREDTVFELALYLVASARDCLDEPLVYGPFRMIEGVSRLIERLGGEDEFLRSSKETIDREKYKVMAAREAFAAWLDELLRGFSAEAKRRNLDTASPGQAGADRADRAVHSLLRIPVRGEAADEFADAFRRLRIFEHACRQPGFLAARLLRPMAEGEPFVVVAEWDSLEAYDGWLENPVREQLAVELEPLLAGDMAGQVYRVASAAERRSG
jgi:heme-degrading monooxygenase HmoA